MPIQKLWGQFRSKVALEVVVTLTVALGSGVTAALWAYGHYAATAYGTPVAVGAGAVLFFVVVGSMNQLQEMDARAQKRRLARRTPAAIEQQIFDWLRQYKFSAKDTKVLGEHDFRIDTENEQKVTISIVKPVGVPWVIAAASIAIDGPAKPIAATPAFRESLTLHLLQLGVEYQLEPPTGTIEVVTLNRILAFDEETQALDLLETLRVIRAGVAVLAAMLHRTQLTQAGPRVVVKFSPPSNVQKGKRRKK